MILTVLSAVPWKEVINATPKVMDATVKLVDRISARQPRRLRRDTTEPDDVPSLRTDIAELQERLDVLEGNDEAQAELIAQMARHEAALLRWIIILSLISVVTGIVAIVGLVVALGFL